MILLVIVIDGARGWSRSKIKIRSKRERNTESTGLDSFLSFAAYL
jgi:hypothetical protein